MNAVQRHTTPGLIYQMLRAAKTQPEIYARDNSRTEDKFVVRLPVELQIAMDEVARMQHRSLNSEVVMAVLDALGENTGSLVELEGLRAYVGNDIARQVIEQVPKFEATQPIEMTTYVSRLPEGVRTQVRAAALESEDGSTSMRAWIMDALIHWVNSRRWIAALTRAAVVLMQDGWVDYESNPTDGTTV